MEGFIGLIPFNLCPTCKAGVYDWAQQQWGDDEGDRHMSVEKNIGKQVIFIRSDQIDFVPLSAIPEDFAGFADDKLVVVLPRHTKKAIPDSIMEVINGYSDVRIAAYSFLMV